MTTHIATTVLLALAALLSAPAVAADHPDRDCWSLEEATRCYMEDARDGLSCDGGSTAEHGACVLQNEEDAARTYARRACDALTGQACTRP